METVCVGLSDLFALLLYHTKVGSIVSVVKAIRFTILGHSLVFLLIVGDRCMRKFEQQSSHSLLYLYRYTPDLSLRVLATPTNHFTLTHHTTQDTTITMLPSTSHFYIHPDDQPDPAITLALSDAVKIFKLFLAYSIFHFLFARRASVSAAIGLYLIALLLLCGFEVLGPFGVDAATTTESLPTTTAATSTITPISCLHTCPDSQPTTATSPHALNNAIQVLEFTLLTFVVLRLLVRFVSTGALVGLSLIIGGFLYDIGVGFPGVEAATTTTILESAVESAASKRPRSTTLWILSAALAVFMLLALIIGHRRRSMPRHSSLTTSYRPLVGRMLIIDKPITSSSMEGGGARSTFEHHDDNHGDGEHHCAPSSHLDQTSRHAVRLDLPRDPDSSGFRSRSESRGDGEVSSSSARR
jgi:hypothetical protein